MMPQSGIELCQLEIPVQDLDNSIAFYGAVLGWKRAPLELHNTIVITNATASSFGVSLVLEQTRKPEPGFHGPLAYFTVADLDKALEQTNKNAGNLVRGPFEIPKVGKAAVILDPSQNHLGLVQRNRLSPT